jgi:hypothetical protein
MSLVQVVSVLGFPDFAACTCLPHVNPHPFGSQASEFLSYIELRIDYSNEDNDLSHIGLSSIAIKEQWKLMAFIF